MKSGDQMRQTHKQITPFIGFKIPFVCRPYPRIWPLICQNKPSVLYRLNSGFTLVELIVALVVAGILMSLAAPSFVNFVKNNRLTTQANALVADLSFARSEAIKRGANITVCRAKDPFAACDAGAGTWGTGWIIVDGAGQVLRMHEALGGGNTLSGTDGSGGFGDVSDQVIYIRSGMTTLVAGSEFRLCDDRGAGEGKLIQLAVTGRPRIDENPPAGC